MEISKNCPYCITRGKTPDVGRHLYINTKKNLCHCKRCNYGGKWDASMLVAEEYIKVDRFKDTELFSFKIKGNNPTANKVYEYIIGRLPKDIVMDKVRWNPDIARAFFPIWCDGEVRMWQGRSINNSLKPKYLTWGSCSQYLYNFENVDDYAVITEGPIDALSTPHGVAIFGKSISSVQFNMLTSKYTKLYWALDEDTNKDEDLANIRELLSQFVEVVVLPMKSDPADMGYDKMKEMIDGL